VSSAMPDVAFGRRAAGRRGIPVIVLWRGAQVHGGPPEGFGWRDGAFTECPRGGERRTGWGQPMCSLGRRESVLGEPRNLMRVGRSRCKAVEAVARVLETLEDRIDLVIDSFVRLC
jgi:hypothetical protein